MQPGFLLLGALLGLAFLAGSSEAQSDQLWIKVDADEMVFQVSEPVTGSSAQDIRQEIDGDYGNGDGTVQTNEVQAYQDDNRATFSKDTPECFDNFEMVQLDGQKPRRLAEIREEIIGATNTRADSTAPLQEVNILHFLYPQSRSDAVTVTFSLSQASDLASTTCATGSAYSGAGARWYAAETSNPMPAPGGDLPEGWDSTWDWDWDGSSSAGQQAAPDTIYRIHPLSGAKIIQATIQPSAARAMWDNVGVRADTEQEEATLYQNRVSFEVQGGASGGETLQGTARNVGAVIGFTTIGAVSLVGAAAVASEFGRYKLLKLLFLVPGFTRLEKDEVLEHGRRDELYRFIKASAGPSFSDLRRELGLSNGTLVHHLRILEAQEYVKPVRDGFRTRFYVRGPKIVPTSYLTRTQQQLLDAIGANPGLTQKELALVLGLPRESISYHTKQLAQKGKLEIKQDGKWRRYFPPATPAGGGTAPL